MPPYPVDLSEIRVSSLNVRSELSPDSVESSMNLEARGQDVTPTTMLQVLTARDVPASMSRAPDHSGAVDPTSINMKGIQALFAIIGAAFVLAAIWFFFWAKNGGFQWRKGDWDDYKSTVLRRKGPNGTTLSNATKSTKLGGGSIVGDGYSDGDGQTVTGTMTETMTEMTETMTEISSSDASMIREKQQARKAARETAKDRKIRQVRAEEWEGGHDNDMRAYRHEKPARVGGINKDSDAMYYGTDYTETSGSTVSSQTGRNNPARQSRTRQPSPEKRQPPSRRDFSFGNDAAFSAVSSTSYQTENQTQSAHPQTHARDHAGPAGPAVPPHRPGRYHTAAQPQHNNRTTQYANTRAQSSVPGAYQASETSVSDVQNQHTKSYHHHIPGLGSDNGAAARASPGAGRSGFRRDRRDSLDD